MRRAAVVIISAVLAATGLAVAPPAGAADAPCATPADDAPPGELTAHGVALMYGECGPPAPGQASSFFSRAILDEDWSWWGRTWAIRMMADALVAEGEDPGLVEPTLEALRQAQYQSVMERREPPPEGQRAFFAHALGWVRYRQGRIEEAVELWRPITDNRHWLEPVPGLFYADMGDAYADLGRHDAAQSWWRHALAARWRPDDTGWDRTRTERQLAQSIAAHGAAGVLPTQNGSAWATDEAREVLDLGGLRRDGDRVRYSIYTLLLEDADGVAWRRTVWEGDCGEPRQLRRAEDSRHRADGSVTDHSTQDWWIETASLSSLQDTELEMMCATSLDGVARAEADPRELLAAYRAEAGGKTR